MNTLQQIRSLWEQGLVSRIVIDLTAEKSCVLVVLENWSVPIAYHCHRYFNINEEWTCNVDRQNTSFAEVMIWLSEQKIPSSYTTKVAQILKKSVQLHESQILPQPEKIEEVRYVIPKAQISDKGIKIFSKNIRLSSIIYLYLLDGKTHKIREFYDRICQTIDPAIAMRTFINSYGKSGGRHANQSQEKKIEIGKMRKIQSHLFSMVRRGKILLSKENANMYSVRDWEISVTSEAMQQIRTNKDISGNTWAAMRKLFARGELDIQLTIHPPKNGEES